MRDFRLACVIGLIGLGSALVAETAQTPAAPAGAQQVPAGAGGPPQGRGRGRGNQVQIQPGQECPPGMSLVRPLTCQPPEFAAPSIVDYRPRNTLVTPEHLVPKAKFPVVDYHGHPGQLINS